MPDHSPDNTLSPQQRWARWPMSFLERLRMPYTAVVAAILLIGLASITLETLLKQQQGWGAEAQAGLVESAVTLVIFLYILGHLRIIKNISIQALAQIRPAVQVDDPAYEQYVARLVRSDPKIELVLGLLAIGLGVVFFVLPADELRALPHQSWGMMAALALIFAYNVLGLMLLLSLVYTAIRHATALGTLARQPLLVNVFDPGPLLPFGRLSVLQSLVFVGIFLIPLIVIGPPKQGGWLVIGLSTLSLLILFVPLWGVHQQIAKTREQVLAGIYEKLTAVQDVLEVGAPAEAEQLKALSERTEALLTFRKHVLSGPSWPFRDFSAVLRAVVAAVSPLIYLILNQLVQTYVFPLFSTP